MSAIAARVDPEPRPFDAERVAALQHLGRLGGAEIAPVDGRHGARAVGFRETAIAAAGPFVMHIFAARARVDSADQVVERRAVNVARHHLGHQLAQRPQHVRDHALADLAMRARRRRVGDIDDGAFRRHHRDRFERTVIERRLRVEHRLQRDEHRGGGDRERRVDRNRHLRRGAGEVGDQLVALDAQFER